jgi:hypothetical protein
MSGDRSLSPLNDATPWYRQRWPWFLIALPASAVIGGVITAVLAVRTFDGPVAADYYKQGLAINQEVDRAQLARVLGLEARVVLAGIAEGDSVRVEVRSQRALPAEATVQLRLVHPGWPGEDRIAVLRRVDADADQSRAVYAGTMRLERGATVPRVPVTWQLILESDRWRIDDSISSAQGGEFGIRAR